MVSAVITTCNREPEIVKEAIDSVCNQSYKDYEIIIVNDSPSYSKNSELEKMIDSYNGKVKYYKNQKTMGANYSRNLGVEKSIGEFVSFLDDDDKWRADRLEKVQRKFTEGADVVYSDFIIFSEKRSSYSKRICPNKNELIREMLAFNFLGGFSNVAIRKSVFNEVGRLDESLPSYQDQDLFIRLVQKSNIAYIPEALSYYRITEHSISLNGEKKLKGLLCFLHNYDVLFQQNIESKVRRLESELIYAEKQGWHDNSKVIARELSDICSPYRILKLRIIGRLKFIAVKYLHMQ